MEKRTLSTTGPINKWRYNSGKKTKKCLIKVVV